MRDMIQARTRRWAAELDEEIAMLSSRENFFCGSPLPLPQSPGCYSLIFKRGHRSK